MGNIITGEHPPLISNVAQGLPREYGVLSPWLLWHCFFVAFRLFVAFAFSYFNIFVENPSEISQGS